MRKILLFLLLGVFCFSNAQDAKSGEESVHNIAALQSLPEYPGGIMELQNYIVKNISIPDVSQDFKVTVYVAFVINKDGTVSDIKVTRDLSYGLKEEIVRVIESNKTLWKAGINDGKPVRVRYNLPIRINVTGSNPSKNEKRN